MAGQQGRRWSKIAFLPINELSVIVAQSETFVSILLHFGLTAKGGNYRTLKRILADNSIDFSHIKEGSGANKGRFTEGKAWALPLSGVLISNSSYTNRERLKIRLLRDGLLVNKCAICNMLPIWNEKPIVFILDHINGTNNDHRLENLRLICPNCNSQTSTFAGRNKNKAVLV